MLLMRHSNVAARVLQNMCLWAGLKTLIRHNKQELTDASMVGFFAQTGGKKDSLCRTSSDIATFPAANGHFGEAQTTIAEAREKRAKKRQTEQE